jgi:hypothetical protein
MLSKISGLETPVRAGHGLKAVGEKTLGEARQLGGDAKE